MANYGIADPCCCDRYLPHYEDRPGIMYLKVDGVAPCGDCWDSCCGQQCLDFNGTTHELFLGSSCQWSAVSPTWKIHIGPGLGEIDVPCEICNSVDRPSAFDLSISISADTVSYFVTFVYGAIFETEGWASVPLDEWGGFSQKVTLDMTRDAGYLCDWENATVTVWG